MNSFAFSILLFSIGSIFMAIQILVRRRDNAGVIYFFLSGLYFIWGITFALMLTGNLPYDISLMLTRISNIAAAFIPVTWLYFCLVYTNRMSANKTIFFLLYLIPCGIAAVGFSDAFIPGLRSIVGFKYYAIAGFVYNFHLSIYFVITPIGFYQLWRSIQSLSGEERSRQLKFLMVSLLGYFGGGLSFFPVYDIAVPQYGLFLLPMYPFGKAYFMGSSGLLFDEERIAQAAHKDKLAALGILTASINHEIRAPLFLMRALVDTEAKGSLLQTRLSDQINRITAIVSRLTHFAKKGVEEAAKIEALDLKEVLSDICPLFQHQINYQSIEYVQNIPADLPKLMADRRYLEEILFNLILNACQALKNTPNPKIILTASDRGGGRQSSGYGPSEIEISISDNGPGISKDQLKNIFKPFHTTKQEGTGLGLYITKQLVEKCDGKIEIKAEPDSGAQFLLQFKS